MSDDWEIYPSTRDGHLVWTSFDRGLAAEIALVVPRTCVRLCLDLRAPSPKGMPDASEFDDLNRFEDALVPFVEERGGLYAGRSTVQGQRWFICYAEIFERDLQAFSERMRTETGYDATWQRTDDPERRAYWDELFPTANDESVIQDLKAFEAVRSCGDSGTQPRPIVHWAYFPDRVAASTFEAFVRQQGYLSLGIEKTTEANTPFSVRFERTDTPALGEFTQSNVHLRRRASELGGTYDGWETKVIKDGA